MTNKYSAKASSNSSKILTRQLTWRFGKNRGRTKLTTVHIALHPPENVHPVEVDLIGDLVAKSRAAVIETGQTN